jgi:ATP-dependent DNA ligase
MPLGQTELVCQVAFVDWTDAWHLRHCTFVAMRDDKKAAEVVREPESRQTGG